MTTSSASAQSGRDPASIAAWVESRIPAQWSDAIGPVAWHVGNLYRDGAAMEADCSGGIDDGPLIGFSDGVYTGGTTTYWRQAYAHEYGHALLCRILAIDPTALDGWISLVGPVQGAPDHIEMFAQCWARYITGAAPRGYIFRCTDRMAWAVTKWFAQNGPPAAPIVAAQPPVTERASSAPSPVG